MYKVLILFLIGLSFTGCVAQNKGLVIKKAIAVIGPTKGNSTSGIVKFIKTDKGIRVTAFLKNLSPGSHGFHIHEFGDCTSDNGTSAGGHFNPTHQSHGNPKSTSYHIGDLGNIVAAKNGQAHLDKVLPHLKLNGPNSIIGRGIIIHAKTDDFTSQPTGAAGKRIACGVIGISKP